MQQREQLIEINDSQLSIRRQCELLSVNRSNIYYQTKTVSADNLYLMRLIDEEYTKHPFYGIRRMTVYLNHVGCHANHKRVERLMKLMGLSAVCPKRNLSKANSQHRIYPYLLKSLEIKYPNQVWCADITYIRLLHGFVYLIAIMDWYSRYVLGWEISNTLEAAFCVKLLEDALATSPVKPNIFNTDQGVQFTSNAFTTLLLGCGIKISMDGKGRVFDNIFIERLWRSVKYEEVYLNDYLTVADAKRGLKNYFNFYNNERPHQSLAYKTPAEIYFGGAGGYVVKDNNILVVPISQGLY